MWGNNKGVSAGLLPGRRFFGPLVLMAVTPLVALLIVRAVRHYDANMFDAGEALAADPMGELRASLVPPTQRAVKALAIFTAFQIVLMRVMPGKLFLGPVTPMGNTPEYTANGLQCFFATLAAFFYFSDAAPVGPQLFSATLVYDEFEAMVSFMCVFALAFCGLLYVKGRVAPSSSDSGVSGYPLFDFYWGTELYPRVFGVDIKTLTNCRFGMMGWPIALLSFAQHQQVTHPNGLTTGLAVSVMLQIVYCAKFFWWETGYWASIDIMHDRAGYYICWGCMVWVPAVYYLPAHVMTAMPEATEWSLPAAAALFAAGWLCIFLNYDSDRQRYDFRQSGGKGTVWGAPAKKVEASYRTADGRTRTSLLLASGYWGLSRHFNYLVEILSALCWSVSALPSAHSALGYFYVLFLTILLLDRAFRDDRRCADKYGDAWTTYCKLVPSRIVPGIL